MRELPEWEFPVVSLVTVGKEVRDNLILYKLDQASPLLVANHLESLKTAKPSGPKAVSCSAARNFSKSLGDFASGLVNPTLDMLNPEKNFCISNPLSS